MADDLLDVETTLESKKWALQRALEDYERAKKDQQSVLEKLERFDNGSVKSVKSACESLPGSVRQSVDALSEAGSGKGSAKDTYVSTLHVTTGDHTDDLAKQNAELRSKLEEEHGSYKRKLQAYQDSQQRQATLVQKLQDKVLQYKKKCSELEQVLQDKTSVEYKSAEELKSAAEKLTSALDERDLDLESAIIHLEEERHRNASLIHVNAMLREQLDQATAANQALTADIAKLTGDWQQTREELEAKEAEWQKEEESFNNFFSQEHSRLLSLWREVVSFRRQFGDMKAANETDLGKVRAEVTKAARTMHSAMQALSSTLRMSDMEKSVALQKSEEARAALEADLAKTQADLAAAQAGAEDLKETLHEKITQLNVLMENQREDLKVKDAALVDAGKKLEALGAEKGDVIVALENKTDEATAVRSQESLLQEALRGIAETLISDAEILPDADVGVSTGLQREPSPLRSSSPSRAPNRAERAPAFAETAVAAVAQALEKRQLQLQDARSKLMAEKDRTALLVKSLDDQDASVKALEDQVLALKEQLSNTGREKDNAGIDKDRLNNSLGVADANKKYLEASRASLIETIANLEKEIEKLRLANIALQRQRDNLEDEKDDIIKDNDRHLKELDRAGQTIDELTGKNSALKEELVATKENLNQCNLDRECIDTERIEVADTLQKTEIKAAELELEISRLKTEEAGLRDALLKMQALNEGLGQDKIELNKLVAALEAEKDELLNKGSDDQDLIESQKETIAKLEGEISDLLAEKNGLEQQLRLTEAQLEAREEEIRILNREKGEVQEQLSTATRQKNALADELLAARQEVEAKTAAAAKLTAEKENLMKEKGNLIVQLTAAERDNRQQAELIAGLKGDKENLETALYETQQLAGLF
jgi:rootletin